MTEDHRAPTAARVNSAKNSTTSTRCATAWKQAGAVRNVYAVDFDPEQLTPLVRRLPTVLDRVTDELRTFADTLERIADDTSE